MQFLELDDVIEIHAGQIANYGGSDGLRDLGLLESALAQPRDTPKRRIRCFLCESEPDIA